MKDIVLKVGYDKYFEDDPLLNENDDSGNNNGGVGRKNNYA